MYRRPHRIKRKKSILRNRWFWRLILFLVFSGEIIYLVFFFPYFQIKNLTIFGAKRVVSADIENFIGKGKGIFLFNSKKTENEILKKYLLVESVKIRKKFPDKLSVQIVERAQNAVWCLNGEPCFNVDKNGIIFEKILVLTYDYIIIKDIQPKNEPALGEKIIEPQLLASIINIAKKTSEWGATPETFTILSQERLNLKIADSGEIYFNLKKDLNWQLTELKTVLENKIPSEKRRKLEYIDLRFDRIFIFPEGIVGN